MIVSFTTQLNKLNHITLQRLPIQVGAIMLINCIVMQTLSSSFMVNGTSRRYLFFFAWTWWNVSMVHLQVLIRFCSQTFAQKQRNLFVHYDNAIFQLLIFIGLDPEQL